MPVSRAMGEVLLGLDRDIADVGTFQMALRAIIIYAFTLAVVRLGSKRFLGKGSAFDIIIGIMIGSVMSRAINGSAPFVPTLGAGAVLIGMHWLLAAIAARSDWFGPLVKGNSILLIENGSIQHDNMRRANLSLRDLEEAIRLQSKEPDPSSVRLARLERDGNISVIPY